MTYSNALGSSDTSVCNLCIRSAASGNYRNINHTHTLILITRVASLNSGQDGLDFSLNSDKMSISL